MSAPVRKIIHVDMDAFYASVEQRDNPDLRGKPVAVGGTERRGVVAAASYEARAFGVHSAMPSFKARMKCPSLIFVPTRADVYRAISLEIRDVFYDHTDLVEPLSLDEAYLDVTENKHGISSATQIAEEIRSRIKALTGLTASAGVSYNKFLAKMASDQRKPDGLFVIPPARGEAFVLGLNVGKFHGIGASTCKRMNDMGIWTGADLRKHDLPFLQRAFGKSGRHFYDICRGTDDRPVQPNRIRKSAGAEDTFERNLRELPDLEQAIQPIVAKAWKRCLAVGARGRKVTVKVKFADFEQITRGRLLPSVVDDETALGQVAIDILRSLAPLPKDVRLLGVTLCNLGADEHEVQQLDLGL